jgi:hypothetical protein
VTLSLPAVGINRESDPPDRLRLLRFPEFCKNLNMTAEQAMQEIWGALCPDWGPENYDRIVAETVTKMAATALSRTTDIVFDGPPGPQ